MDLNTLTDICETGAGILNNMNAISNAINFNDDKDRELKMLADLDFRRGRFRLSLEYKSHKHKSE